MSFDKSQREIEDEVSDQWMLSAFRSIDVFFPSVCPFIDPWPLGASHWLPWSKRRHWHWLRTLADGHWYPRTRCPRTERPSTSHRIISWLCFPTPDSDS